MNTDGMGNNGLGSHLCRMLEWLERQIQMYGVDCEMEVTKITDKIRNKMKEK